MRKTPEIPSASMADIAFMLLIFFITATSMDVDSGLERVLPQMPPPDQEKDDTPPIKERNVFTVLLDANNRLMVEGELSRVEDLRDKAKEFMMNPYDAENLPEKKPTEIPLLGTYPVTKGVISLRNDHGTQYGTYIAVQNELVAAVNELRNELSSQKFGKKYEELTTEQKDAIRDAIPSRISEAEPKQIGGKK
ncbi:MAG TPA: biopolymer transporter ExbD [Prolixibacteraceae bacterium]|nr:biopolymer transporter ExbD [Prolixibacteraceae bacterium]